MSPSSPSAVSRLPYVSKWCCALGALAAAGACVALCGWTFNIQRLTDWFATGVSQMPNNAVAVLAAGVGLSLLCRKRAIAAAACGAIAAVIGGTTLFQHLSGVDLGIDSLLIQRDWGQTMTTAPGRMGLPASTALTVVGISIVLAGLTRFRGAVMAGGLLTGAIAMLSIIGYSFGADPLFAIPKYTAISLQTSVLLLALTGGLLTCNRGTAFMEVLEGDSAAGCLARRAIPGVIGFPLLLGWLTVLGLKAQLFDAAFALALLVSGLIALLCGLLWWSVTAVRRHEEALYRKKEELAEILGSIRASEERMQLAMTIADAGTWDLDLKTGVNHWSDSHFSILGYEPAPDGIATKSMWRNAVVAEDLPGVIRESERASAENDLFRSEHRLRRADTGEITWVTSAGRFFYDDGGLPVRFVGVFFDITAQKRNEEELKRLAEELRKADQRKDEFLATLAHELRNPLAPVLNSVEVLKCLGAESQAAASARAMIERQIGQMVRLIDDLLDVGRISRNKLELRIETVELGTVLREALEAVEPAMQQAGHELVARIPAEVLSLQEDSVRLCQIFGNLLTNACKYTEPGGRIELTAVEEEGAVAISVKDNGLGIPPEMLNGIFELFSQVDRSLERSQGGLGIGLTLVRRLVELHGGTVSAHSDGHLKGSVFVVRLPLAPDECQPCLPSVTKGSGSAAVRSRILVVDDNVDSAQSLAMLLELSGHEVKTANDGREGLELAGRFQPDLILLDIGMPGMSGYEVCRQVRQMSSGIRPRIIALTGWGMEDDRRKSGEAGFDGHLVKPVEPAVLLALIGNTGF